MYRVLLCHEFVCVLARESDKTIIAVGLDAITLASQVLIISFAFISHSKSGGLSFNVALLKLQRIHE